MESFWCKSIIYLRERQKPAEFTSRNKHLFNILNMFLSFGLGFCVRPVAGLGREREVYFGDIEYNKVNSDSTTWKTQKFTEKNDCFMFSILFSFVHLHLEALPYRLLVIFVTCLYLHVELGMFLKILFSCDVFLYFSLFFMGISKPLQYLVLYLWGHMKTN